MKVITIILFCLCIILLILLVYSIMLNRFTEYNGVKYSSNLSINEIINLNRGQEKMTNILRELDRICRKYNLKYWCVGGTLIGCVRHNGWIPWDGDVDVAMLPEDYKIFREKVINEIPSNLVFTEPEDKPCSKLSDKTAVYMYSKHGNNWDVGNYIMLDIFIYKKTENNKIYGEHCLHDYDVIFPLKEHQFEDLIVYIPNNYDKFLKNFATGSGLSFMILHGNSFINYMDYPPPLKRYPHEGPIKHLS